ncbi:MAG: HDIG domain-containing metalloprotein [Pseudomonadota bacterium]
MKPENKIHSINRYIGTTPSVLWGLLVIITLIFSIVLYPEKGTITFSYQQGDVADRDIKAPKDFFIEDRDATEQNRKDILKTVLSVYDYDPGLAGEISTRVTNAFLIPQKLFPSEAPEPPALATVLPFMEKFESTLDIPISKGAFTILYKNNFSPLIPEKMNQIITEILGNGVASNKELMLKEEDKGIVLRTLNSTEEKVVNNLKVFYGPDQAKTMVRIVGDPLLKDVDYNLSNLVVDMCQRLLKPNITMNRSETENRKRALEATIKPVLYKIKAGEMILREGERVDEIRLVKLRALESQMEKKNLVMAQTGTALIILFSLLVIYFLFLKNHKNLQRHHNKNIIFLSTLLMLFLLIARLAAPLAGSVNLDLPVTISSVSIALGLPMAAGAMTVCLFLGFDIALYFSFILALLTAIIFSSCIEVFIFCFLSGIIASSWIKASKERKAFITAGLKLAIFNTGLALALNIHSAHAELDVLSRDMILAFFGGILSGIITAGLAPLIELLFNYTTDIKLLELSNLEQPLMKRLMIEAPGTYNHSIIVASLAEAAAAAIEASILKTKVSAFYHDIGKLDKPLYFIENQTDGKNRHDKLSPSISALILIQHVKRGAEIAKENKLGMDILDTIQQHHGTSLIRYFYNKSIKLNGEDAVKESDFRYPGPKPQTRETGIVMLADVVEAAMRTLDRPTSSRIQGKVQELINAIFADGQLEECELTLKDLHQIAKSFNKILTGIYHHRIEYTDKPQEKKKEKNGKPENPDQDPTVKDKDTQGADKQKNQPNLKRLGI